MVAFKLHTVGADIVLEAVTLFHTLLKVKAIVRFFAVTVKTVENTQAVICIKFLATGTKAGQVH